MGVEIERKYLVVGDAWREGAEGVLYRQGYLAANEGATVRVRVAGDEAFLTLKGPTRGLSREEFEYPIPVADAEEILAALCAAPLVEKLRYRVPFAGRVWEVDEFLGENAGLVVAEVELESPDAPLETPSWAGPEVSHDPRYRNANLSANPYCRW